MPLPIKQVSDPVTRYSEINGLSTKGMDADKASKLIKGKEGSIVVIKITRERASHPIEFEIVRSPIQYAECYRKNNKRQYWTVKNKRSLEKLQERNFSRNLMN